MREIKFRGKIIDEGYKYGEWVYGGLYCVRDEWNNVTCYIVTEKWQTYRVDPETVGQYAGKKDKNGKEVYEGDILRTYPRFDWDKEREFIVVVCFGHHMITYDGACAWYSGGLGFYFKIIKTTWRIFDKSFLEFLKQQNATKPLADYYISEDVNWDNEFEVIGNIYDNPELLSSKKENQDGTHKDNKA